jgi:hypothetical protein
MNKSKRVIDVIEMTVEEENTLWDAWAMGKNHDIIDWETSDGHNKIQLAGEDFYRPVVRPRVDIF